MLNSLNKVAFYAYLCLFLTACPSKKNTGAASQSKPFATKGGEAGRQAVPVRVATVASQQLPRIIEVGVSLTGKQQLNVFSRVAGRITQLGPNESRPVKTGEVLFKVDRSDPGENFLETPIVSPIAGYIGQWYVTVGTQVTPQTAVVQVVDDRILKAEISLPAADWALIKQNSRIKITSNEKTREARLTVISRAADPNTGRGTFEVELDNKDRSWKAGIVARASIEIDLRKRMIIPTQALTITDQGTYVYTIENNQAKRTPVKFEVMSNDTVEVLSGLSPGNVLVTVGNNALSDRSAVRILDENKPRERKEREGQTKP